MLFTYIPLLMLLYRLYIYVKNEIRFYGFAANSFFAKIASKASLKQLKEQVPDNETLQDVLTPKFAFGCKRLMLTDDYYPALNLSHVHVHTGNILEVNDYSIAMDNGITQNLDVLILATGFRVQEFFSPMQVIGKNSENILKKWQETRPRLYYGIVNSETPNQFILLGPNTALGHNTVVFMIECQVDFTIKIIKEMMTRNVKYVAIKESVEDEYMKILDKRMGKTVWGTEKCGSWYANQAGVITSLWPKNCGAYWRETKYVDFSKFNFK